MVIASKKAYKQGGTGVITVGKDMIGKEVVFTDELSEKDVMFMISFKEVLRGDG